MSIAKDKIETHLKHYANELADTGFEDEAYHIREILIPIVRKLKNHRGMRAKNNSETNNSQSQLIRIVEITQLAKIIKGLEGKDLLNKEQHDLLHFFKNIAYYIKQHQCNNFILKQSFKEKTICFNLYQYGATDCDNLQETLLFSFEISNEKL